MAGPVRQCKIMERAKLRAGGAGRYMGLFRKKLKPEHKALLQAERARGALMPEYHRATPECPHPKRWSMYDSMTAEVEVLELLRTMVTTVKPELIVETGSFLGVSTLWMAEGLKQNGFGKIVSCEVDPVVLAKAQQKIAESGLSKWIDLRHQSSLDMKIDGMIDIFYSDSEISIREDEVRHFLPQINPNGLILIHDASSHMKIVREAALRMQAEGLISVVCLPTPRGLVIAQKRESK